VVFKELTAGFLQDFFRQFPVEVGEVTASLLQLAVFTSPLCFYVVADFFTIRVFKRGKTLSACSFNSLSTDASPDNA
jgi:hypothetical protein